MPQIFSVPSEKVLVLKLDRAVRIGARVYYKNVFIGKIFDLIGPVKSPYALVKLEKSVKLAVGDEVEVRKSTSPP